MLSVSSITSTRATARRGASRASRDGSRSDARARGRPAARTPCGRASRRISSRRRRRRCLRNACSRYRIGAQSTVRNRRRLNRWMRIGTATSASAPSAAGDGSSSGAPGGRARCSAAGAEPSGEGRAERLVGPQQDVVGAMAAAEHLGRRRRTRAWLPGRPDETGEGPRSAPPASSRSLNLIHPSSGRSSSSRSSTCRKHDLVVAVAQSRRARPRARPGRRGNPTRRGPRPLGHLVRDLREEPADPRLPRGHGLLEHLRERREVALGRGVRRNTRRSSSTTTSAERVALLAQERREARDRRRGVIELRARARPVSHRRARVDDERRAQVVLGLAEADDVVARAAVDAPVEPPQIVTRHVGPVIGELGALAEVGTAVSPADPREPGGARPGRRAGAASADQDRSTFLRRSWAGSGGVDRNDLEELDTMSRASALGLGDEGRDDAVPKTGAASARDVFDLDRRPADQRRARAARR